MSPTLIICVMVFMGAIFALEAITQLRRQREASSALFWVAAICCLSFPLAVWLGVAKIDTGAPGCDARQLAACFVWGDQ